MAKPYVQCTGRGGRGDYRPFSSPLSQKKNNRSLSHKIQNKLHNRCSVLTGPVLKTGGRKKECYLINCETASNFFRLTLVRPSSAGNISTPAEHLFGANRTLSCSPPPRARKKRRPWVNSNNTFYNNNFFLPLWSLALAL